MYINGFLIMFLFIMLSVEWFKYVVILYIKIDNGMKNINIKLIVFK